MRNRVSDELLKILEPQMAVLQTKREAVRPAAISEKEILNNKIFESNKSFKEEMGPIEREIEDLREKTTNLEQKARILFSKHNQEILSLEAQIRVQNAILYESYPSVISEAEAKIRTRLEKVRNSLDYTVFPGNVNPMDPLGRRLPGTLSTNGPAINEALEYLSGCLQRLEEMKFHCPDSATAELEIEAMISAIPDHTVQTVRGVDSDLFDLIKK